MSQKMLPQPTRLFREGETVTEDDKLWLRLRLDLVPGADVQAWASVLDAIAALPDAAGALSNDGAGGLSWTNSGGGGGATNLSFTAGPDSVTVASDTGTDAVLPVPDGTNAGVFLAAEKIKLAGVEDFATENAEDAFLLARANHTGTQDADTITDGTANKVFTAAEKTKLAGITGVNTGDQDLSGYLTTTGNGSGLTALNGTQITTGTVAAARIDALIARLASPALTGTPTAPTAARGTSTTLLATTAFAMQALAAWNNVITEATAARSLSATDAGMFLHCTNAAGCAITVPPNATVPVIPGTEIFLSRDTAAGPFSIINPGVVIKNSGIIAALPADGTLCLKNLTTDVWKAI